MIDAEPIGNPSDSGQLAPTAERLAPLLDVRPPAATAPPVQAPAVIMNKRAQSVEPAFGTLKRWLNGGRFLRGRLNSRTEPGLVTLAFNLERLANLHGTRTHQQALA